MEMKYRGERRGVEKKRRREREEEMDVDKGKT